MFRNLYEVENMKNERRPQHHSSRKSTRLGELGTLGELRSLCLSLCSYFDDVSFAQAPTDRISKRPMVRSKE